MDISFIDIFVISLYLLAIFTQAFFVGNRSSKDFSAESQYLANKDLSFKDSFFSIIATEVSALTFLGIPAFAFNLNFSFVQIYIGAIFGRFIIAKYFLPKVYGKGLTIYEIIAQNNGTLHGRRALAIFYLMAKVFSVGVRLFSGSILVAQFLQINTYLGLALLTFITFFYTLIGGLKAVVRTDFIQMLVFIGGGLCAHYLIPLHDSRGWLEMMEFATLNNKTMIFDFTNPTSILLGVFGGILFDMSTHGVDQDFVQRLTAVKSLKKAQLAIFFSSFLSISVGLLFLSVGALLWSHYQLNPFPSEVESADHLFAYFIVHHFPSGLKGLMVAGVVATTMSTLDSTINALCACLYNDILPSRNKRSLKTYFLFDNLSITLTLLFIAILASQYNELLLLGLKIQSWTAGPLLAIFLSKKIFSSSFNYKLTPYSVVLAYMSGSFAVYTNSFILEWNWNLNVYAGTLAALLGLKLISKVTKK